MSLIVKQGHFIEAFLDEILMTNTMKSLYLKEHFAKPEDIKIEVKSLDIPQAESGYCVIKVISAGVNQSDALATIGYFNHAVLSRIPGRDFAGVVVDGNPEDIGKKVWGSGGAAGIEFDGTHCEYIKIPENAIAEIPENLDITLAGAQTLPYLTAYYGLVPRGNIRKDESILITGALGQVGFAAMSIAKWKGCNCIALVHGKEDKQAAINLGWKVVEFGEDNLADKIIALNNGKKIDVVFNSIGNLLWDTYLGILAEFGRIITIGAKPGCRDAVINLFDLYRANQTIIGINSVDLDYVENALLLNEMRNGFIDGSLLPLKISAETTFKLANASEAYKLVLAGSGGKRVVLTIESNQ